MIVTDRLTHWNSKNRERKSESPHVEADPTAAIPADIESTSATFYGRNEFPIDVVASVLFSNYFVLMEGLSDFQCLKKRSQSFRVFQETAWNTKITILKKTPVPIFRFLA